MGRALRKQGRLELRATKGKDDKGRNFGVVFAFKKLIKLILPS